MSSKQNNTINLANYEEFFLLYMDNELSAEDQLMVKTFVAGHPYLAEELELLMSTRLPLDEVTFTGKKELLSGAMKVTTIDEALLLYIDNELPLAERKAVEEKIATNPDYALQHALLLRTKPDVNEEITHPAKEELYRHQKRVVPFGIWMRIAAAIVILLFGSLFFLQNKSDTTIKPGFTTSRVDDKPNPPKAASPLKKNGQLPTIEKEKIILAKLGNPKAPQKVIKPILSEKKDNQRQPSTPSEDGGELVLRERQVIKFDAARLTSEPQISHALALNKPITYTSVTSGSAERTPIDEDETEAAGSDGDFKQTRKTPAKGFFRKVSRFIERRTGIGTVNADNELLIGAVALKLK